VGGDFVNQADHGQTPLATKLVVGLSDTGETPVETMAETATPRTAQGILITTF
jgi:hypothetical protein